MDRHHLENVTDSVITRMVPIEDSNHHVYENLAQAYEAEFSPVTGKFPEENGKYKLDTICREPHFGYLFYEDNIPIGFVVLGFLDQSYDVAEFYVIPTHRRHGIGRHMALRVFARYHGHWQVRQMVKADWAVAFWRRVIGEYCAGEYQEDLVDDAYYGPVMRQRFVSNPCR
ncbi:GNAT family N-acetyltransferase [Desulfoferrobacter suflitae]|uniref:GNAT family N-acetyltransferase n=1 Tax=Desulfoferrobacter suflitae TaxID=2865782 RepID=UPI002164A27E|nr:GNAT family N-acetyltransferase [Desulfoferrobacter suflitae]MCK8601876.1 GNAT family N-acetyltransferase [Desulfoferrobacter suflitae]